MFMCFELIMLEPCLLQLCFHVAGRTPSWGSPRPRTRLREWVVSVGNRHRLHTHVLLICYSSIVIDGHVIIVARSQTVIDNSYNCHDYISNRKCHPWAFQGHGGRLLRSPRGAGGHSLSNATCLMRLHLFYACLVVSRITIICNTIRYF